MRDAPQPLPATAGMAPPARHGAVAAVALRECEAATILHLEGAREGADLAAFRTSLGLAALPGSGRSGGTAERQLLCIAPATWLLVAPAAAAAASRAALGDAFEAALDMSQGWTRFAIDGARRFELLAKGCALDLHPREFPPGACAAAAFARLRTIVWRPPEAGHVELFVGRSYAVSLWEWLIEAAEEYGVAAGSG